MGADGLMFALSLPVHQLCCPLTVPAFTFRSLSPPSKRDLYHSREVRSTPPPTLRYTLPPLGLSHLRHFYKEQLKVALMPSIPSDLQMKVARGRGRQEVRTPKNTVPLIRTLWKW